MLRIAVLDDYQRVAAGFAPWSELDGNAYVTFFHDTPPDRDALVERLAGFDVVCVMRERTPIDAVLLAQLPRLRLLVTTGMHNAAIDVAAASYHGVTMCGTRSIGHSTAELAFAFILGLARGIPGGTASLEQGGWQSGVGRDLHGARLGLIGLGRLGSLVAGYGRAFGMDVAAWSSNLSGEEAVAKGARRMNKAELFETSDFISIHTRLSCRSEGLVGREELDRMRSDAFLINTSRAAIVDEDALVDALRERRIAGAALDVFDIEPLPREHRLRTVPNLLLTPHIGYVTRDTYRAFYGDTLEAVQAWISGQPIRVLT
ncbi:hydroxyacid dehydrogenase (plasmid) [Neorhizobium sp. SOG26]|uniref:D-2-hydroxyacid dehydrogenase family protein n=1 Tax=Neorhizobium sp. SOG26 TaxID=2060726 RepID=UPI000E593B68|nr:D-2-hydroxyacid dehydrogenase family protein [Neorhizobium sp. SOG26]AXV17886.1 hydroxyacid dehydrogenase [Neorhizobium sp. SOG26]